MATITHAMVQNAVNVANGILVERHATWRFNFSRRYDYYALDPVSAKNPRVNMGYALKTGSKRDIYEYLKAWINGATFNPDVKE